MFYFPTHSTRIFETENARFIENGETNGSESPRNVEIKEVRLQVPLTSTSTSIFFVARVVESHNDEEEEQISDPENNSELVVEQPQEIVLRRSQIERNYAISNDYVVYLQESKNDLAIDNV